MPRPARVISTHGFGQLDGRPALRLHARGAKHETKHVELLARNGERVQRLRGEIAGFDIATLRQGMTRAHDRDELVFEKRVHRDPPAANRIADDPDVEIAREKRRDRPARRLEDDPDLHSRVRRLELPQRLRQPVVAGVALGREPQEPRRLRRSARPRRGPPRSSLRRRGARLRSSARRRAWASSACAPAGRARPRAPARRRRAGGRARTARGEAAGPRRSACPRPPPPAEAGGAAARGPGGARPHHEHSAWDS